MVHDKIFALKKETATNWSKNQRWKKVVKTYIFIRDAALYKPLCKWTGLNEPTAVKINVISFLIWEINKFSLRNGAFTKIHSVLSRAPFSLAYSDVYCKEKSLRFSFSDVVIRCGSKEELKKRGARVLWFYIMDVISDDMKFEQLRRTPDIWGLLSICREQCPNKPTLETRVRKLPYIKAQDASVYEMPGASPEAR